MHEGDLSLHACVLILHDIHLELELVLLLHKLLLLHGVPTAAVVVRNKELLFDSLALQLRQLWALVTQGLKVDRVDALIGIGESDIRVGRCDILHFEDVGDYLSAACLPVLLRRLIGRELLHSVLLIDVAGFVAALLVVLAPRSLVLDCGDLILGRRRSEHPIYLVVRVVEVVHGLGKGLLRHMRLELNVNDLACCHRGSRASDVVLRMSSHVTAVISVLGPCPRSASLSLVVLAQLVVIIEAGAPLLIILR